MNEHYRNLESLLTRIFLHLTLAGVLLSSFPPPVRAGGEYQGPTSPQELAQLRSRNTQIGRLWINRRNRDVVPQLLKLLATEKALPMQESIIKVLGRIEDLRGLNTLQGMLSRAHYKEGPRSRSVPKFRLQLAIGRINARKLRGQAKLNAIARSVGTNWMGIQQMAATTRIQLHNRRTSYDAQESVQLSIIKEFYDVLYRMGKRGENIKSLGSDKLRVWNNTEKMPDALYAYPQNLLDAASLSNQQEIKFWLTRAMPPHTTTLDPAHLLDLGPAVSNELIKYLKTCFQLLKVQPQLAARTSAYRSVFDAAASSGDKRLLPILRQFQQIGDRWVRIFARHAASDLETGVSSVVFP